MRFDEKEVSRLLKSVFSKDDLVEAQEILNKNINYFSRKCTSNMGVVATIKYAIVQSTGISAAKVAKDLGISSSFQIHKHYRNIK